MGTTLETERLLLRPLQLADAARTQEIFPHWEVVRYLNAIVPWPYPADGALTYYRDVALPAMARREQWHWTLRLKQHPAEHIGGIGLSSDKVDNRGFWLGLPWQRQGLMMEASVAVTEYWFEVLEFPVLRTRKAVANVASKKISARMGMRMTGLQEHDFVEGRLPAEVWEITSEEWAGWKLAKGDWNGAVGKGLRAG